MSNPFLRTFYVRTYETFLRLPVIARIRREEHAMLMSLFDDLLRPEDTVLEIGSGSGAYTFDIARRVRHVTALEQSPEFVRRLRGRVSTAKVTNIAVVEGDFRTAEFTETFDHVVAIGVFDYIEAWEPFLRRCLRSASRSVLFTVPQRGLLGTLYRSAARLGRVAIYPRDRQEMLAFLDPLSVRFAEAGLGSRWNSALTLAVSVELPKNPVSHAVAQVY